MCDDDDDDEQTETLYLVGDIVDGMHVKETWYWPQTHNEVFSAILRKGRNGTKIVYIPGNHDIAFRNIVRAAGQSQEVLYMLCIHLRLR